MATNTAPTRVLISLRGCISGMDQRRQAASSRVLGLREDKAPTEVVREHWRRCQSKFFRVSQSDLYPGLPGNVKLVKPSELPIMSARDISRHRHSLTGFGR